MWISVYLFWPGKCWKSQWGEPSLVNNATFNWRKNMFFGCLLKCVDMSRGFFLLKSIPKCTVCCQTFWIWESETTKVFLMRQWLVCQNRFCFYTNDRALLSRCVVIFFNKDGEHWLTQHHISGVGFMPLLAKITCSLLSLLCHLACRAVIIHWLKPLASTVLSKLLRGSDRLRIWSGQITVREAAIGSHAASLSCRIQTCAPSRTVASLSTGRRT